MDFAAATTALGQAAVDFRTFLLAQGVVVASVLGVIGGFVLTISAIRAKTGINKALWHLGYEHERKAQREWMKKTGRNGWGYEGSGELGRAADSRRLSRFKSYRRGWSDGWGDSV